MKHGGFGATRRRFGAMAVALATTLGASALLPNGTADAQTTPDPGLRAAREVRTIWTDEFGISRPAGLAYDATRRTFLVAGDAPGAAQILRIDPRGKGQGVSRVARVSDPALLAFDSRNDRLVGIDAGQRTTARGSELGGAQASWQRDALPALGASPRSATFGSSGGTWDLLDPTTDTVIRVAGDNAVSRLSLRGVGDPELIAANPEDGLLYVLSPAQRRLYGVDASGTVQKAFDVSASTLETPVAMVFAPSTDNTDAAATQNLYVADSGTASTFGGVTELSLATVAVAAAPVDTGTLVRTTATSAWSPGSPDPAGVAYSATMNRLIVVDSEVDETTGAGWNNVNMWVTRLDGTPTATGTFWGGNSALFNGSRGLAREPTGADFDAVGNRLFVTDDSARKIFIIAPGANGTFGNTDDVVTAVDTLAIGSSDTEDPLWDPVTGDLYFLDGASTEIYRIQSIDGVFGNGNDAVTHFDISTLGPTDFEGLARDPARGTLYVGARATKQIFEITTTGELLRTISLSGVAGLTFVSGLEIAPSSANPSQNSIYIVDRAVDNGPVPTENDGKLFEVSAPNLGPLNLAPTVNAGADRSITLPTDSVNLAGTASDDGLPTGSTLATTWSKVSGPGTVSFADANALSTTATFSAAGQYTVRLTASDGQLSATDDVVVSVTEASNSAPTVNAGADQSITLPQSATLAGSVGDDGLPAGVTVSSTWSKASGPGVVTFADPSAPGTTASFSLPGTYVLRLSASDTQLSAEDTVQITVNDPQNAAPVVNAGADQTIPFGTTATIGATVTDDGLPTGNTLLFTWTTVSGPGTVSFGNAAAKGTTATFSAAGVYTLRMTASDGSLSASDDVVITVNATPTVSAGPDRSVTLPASATLSGTVADDGLPSNTLTATWSTVSGPGTVTFANASAASTTATFSAAGSYTLRLTASDGAASASDDMIVTAVGVRQIDVAAVSLSASRNRNNVSGTARVTVRDANNALVSGATVTGQWRLNGTLQSTRTATTGTNGIASINSGSIRASVGQVLSFCVTGLSLSGATWNTALYTPAGGDCVSYTVV